MAVSGWVRGARTSGLPNTADGVPSDPGHSFGCFDLGHTAYVQAIGTSASAPLVAGAAALLRAAHPDWDATKTVNVLRSTATTPTPTSANPRDRHGRRTQTAVREATLSPSFCPSRSWPASRSPRPSCSDRLATSPCRSALAP
ncbi:S8 family serine peptidase [Edaphobacter aggregans]|uniref:S8 family serine peptidase n=1 Tax=Edaphobacter aggregans TaxID=570835 RepID=UPI0012F77089|nr:S8 family serine peptidase [Edaphobacter aggregans]